MSSEATWRNSHGWTVVDKTAVYKNGTLCAVAAFESFGDGHLALYTEGDFLPPIDVVAELLRRQGYEVTEKRRTNNDDINDDVVEGLGG